MPCLETRWATDFSAPSERAGLVERVLSKLIPAANPNFDSSDYACVRRWWIEVDPSSHRPEREIDFDAQDEPIIAGPLGPNLGFWTDSDMTFDPATHTPVADDNFEQAWTQAVHQIAKTKGLTLTD